MLLLTLLLFKFSIMAASSKYFYHYLAISSSDDLPNLYNYLVLSYAVPWSGLAAWPAGCSLYIKGDIGLFTFTLIKAR